MLLTPDQFKRIDELFREAGALPPDSRDQFVASKTTDDPIVRSEVLALLAHDSEPRVDLDASPLAGVLADYRTNLSHDATSTSLPDRIGSYRILSRLGEGGFGVVFLAEQENPRREVALKVLRSPFASERTLRRFEYEAQILGRLQHPGIAQIFEAGTAVVLGHRQAFFAMEHVRGQSIREYCDAAGDPPRKLGTRERLALFAKVLDALQHAHSHGVIHRDLKPDNILVDAAGQPKILDFGVARIVTDDSNVTTMATGVGQLVGTLPYMSPEQVLGDPAAIDTRSDIYSAGVVLYELLTGCLPHDLRNRSILDATRAIREDEPTPLSARNKSLRGEIQTIVAKSLEKNRTRRYQSAAELAEEIRRYLRGEPISAKRDSQWYVLRKTMRRYRLALTVAVSFFLVVTAALAVSLQLLRDATHARERADQATEQALASKTRAEHRFSQVREIAHKFLFDFHDEIRTISGTTTARRKLVDTALQYVSSLTEDAANDPDLQLELAEAYRKIGDAQGWPALANLGEREAARASYQRALSVLATITSDDEVIRQRVRVARIRTLLHDADILHNLGLDDQAAIAYREVIAGFAAELEKSPKNGALREGVVVALINYSISLSGPDDLKSRTAAVQQAEQLLRQYIADNPNDTNLRAQLVQVLTKLGRLHYARVFPSLRDPHAAMNYFDSALKLIDELQSNSPDDARLQLMRASVISGMSDVHLARRELDDALRLSRDVVDDIDKLVRSDRADLMAAEMLDAALGQLSEVYERRGELDEAIRTNERCFEIIDSLRVRDPNSRTLVSRAAVQMERLGRLAGQQQRGADCRRYYDRAMNLWLEAESQVQSAANSERREQSIAAYARYCSAMIALNQPRDAAQTIRRAGAAYVDERLDSGDVECLIAAAVAEFTIADYLVKIATESPEEETWRRALLDEAIGRYERASQLQNAAILAAPNTLERRPLAEPQLADLRDFARAVAQSLEFDRTHAGGPGTTGSTVVELGEPGHNARP